MQVVRGFGVTALSRTDVVLKGGERRRLASERERELTYMNNMTTRIDEEVNTPNYLDVNNITNLIILIMCVYALQE